MLALTLSALGDFAEGRCHGEEALRLAALAGRATDRPWSTAAWGPCTSQGDLAHAIRVFEQGLTLCRASRSRMALRA